MSPSLSYHQEWSLSFAPCSKNSSAQKPKPSPSFPTASKSPPTAPGKSSSATSHVTLKLAILTTDFGHDKSRAIKPYAAVPADGRPILVYCGDGVSDISAARETDLLFAKKGRDLVTHCLNENVPFYPFDVCIFRGVVLTTDLRGD